MIGGLRARATSVEHWSASGQQIMAVLRQSAALQPWPYLTSDRCWRMPAAFMQPWLTCMHGAAQTCAHLSLLQIGCSPREIFQGGSSTAAPPDSCSVAFVFLYDDFPAVNECTHLARQAEQWLPGPGPEPVRAALLRWLRVFPLALMDHLREEESLESLVKG